MRIIALPITAPAATNASASPVPKHLMYYYFIMPPPSLQHKRNNWSEWVTTKAANMWAGLGKAPEETWKVCLVHSGSIFFCRSIGRRAARTMSTTSVVLFYEIDYHISRVLIYTQSM